MIIIVMLTWSFLLFITILENEINFNKATNEKQNKINKLNETKRDKMMPDTFNRG